MTDLVKRLRDGFGRNLDSHVMAAAADRIEELEAALRAARPTILAAANEPGISPWLKDARDVILATVDEALKTEAGR